MSSDPTSNPEPSSALGTAASEGSMDDTFAATGPDGVDTAAGSYDADPSGPADETADRPADPGEDPAVPDGAPTDAGSAGSAGAPDASDTPDVSLLVREGDVAADYLEQFLDIVDYDGDIDLDVENGRAIVAVVGSDLHPLVGAGGATLDALQELTRLAVQQQTGVRSRLMLDVSGHRSNRRKQLSELAQATATAVLADGEPVRLAPMNPFERKVVHDAISAVDGVRSESEGDEPQRRVVVHPDH